MIFNPTVIAGGGGASTELVSVTFKGGPSYCYHYYSTIENGAVVMKTSSADGQTIQAIKGSIVFAFTDRMYNTFLNAIGARTIFNIDNVLGSEIDAPDYSLIDSKSYTVRVYEATG